MRKEREIIIKVIQKENISNRGLARLFANKYNDNRKCILKEKS